jgi:hypothetical protein
LQTENTEISAKFTTKKEKPDSTARRMRREQIGTRTKERKKGRRIEGREAALLVFFVPYS